MHRAAVVVLVCLGLSVAGTARAQSATPTASEGASGLAAPRARPASSAPPTAPEPPPALAAPAPTTPAGDALPPAYAAPPPSYPSPGYPATPAYGPYGVQPGYGGYAVPPTSPGYGPAAPYAGYYGPQPGYGATPYFAPANDPQQLAQTRRRLRRERILAGMASAGAAMLVVGLPFVVRDCHMGLSTCGDAPHAANVLVNGGVAIAAGTTIGASIPAFRVSRHLQRLGIAPRRGMLIGALVTSFTGYGTPIAPLLLMLHARSARRALDGVARSTQPTAATFSLVPYVDARSGASGLRLDGTF